MNNKKKKEIETICKSFAEGFQPDFPSINGTGWLIVDPMSGFLNFEGHENKLHELPANENHPQILIMTFNDGTQFIPAGEDLKAVFPDAKNWMWL